MNFYGRESEIAELCRIQKLAFESYSKMVVVTGRRRIGKTSLITEALARSPYQNSDIPTLYLFVGRKSEGALCRQFAEEASRVLGSFIPPEITSFGALFRMLMEIGQSKRFNLVLDEFQEFATINPSVFSDIQHYWDSYRKSSKIYLLISGSLFTLMHKIFQDAGEPLFGRADNILNLKAFSPTTLKQIIADYNPGYSNDDLLALFCMTGGVPKYVELLLDGNALTTSRMIAFAARENSPFIDEGRNLLITEFGKNYGTYFAVIGAVSQGAVTQQAIEQAIGISSIGGHMSRLTNDYQILKKARPLFAKKASQSVRYEIEDIFLRFWFAYFDTFRPLVELGNFKELATLMKTDYPRYSGLMLERYFKIKLAESGAFREIGSWWESKGNNNEIDLVALRTEKNRALAVEVKRKQENYRLSKLEEKVKHLKEKAMPHYQFELKCLSLQDM